MAASTRQSGEVIAERLEFLNWDSLNEQHRLAIDSIFVIVDGLVRKDHGAINVLAAVISEI